MWLEECTLLKKWLQWEVKDDELGCRLSQVSEWDSFNTVQFMVEMESCFGVKVSLEDLDDIITVEDLLKYMNKWRKNNVFK